MEREASEDRRGALCAVVEPGVCGLACRIEITNLEKRRISLTISGSECRQVQEMGRLLDELTLQDLFAPVSRNPVFLSAEKARCHSSCIVPAAILKLAEVAMGMALPREARIKF